MKRIVMFWLMLGCAAVFAQTGEVMVNFESIEAAQLAERQAFQERKQALQQQPASPQRDAQLREEIQRHQAESKRLSVQQQAARKEVISDLKQKWTKVESDWKNETTRHDAAKKQLEKLPDGPAKTAQIEAENAAHRSTSKQIAAQRNVVHEGVINQANRDVMGGTSNASNSAKQTAGTTITDPNHRGMNGDFDAGGGYRTTEKAGKILNEIGVKGPNGGPVKVTGGVLETAPDFGMTVNAAPGTDRVGSAGHQTQVKVGAQHGETYVSETGGSLKQGALKDHVATMDHAKKAMHGTSAPPETLVGGAPEGQMMAKGAVKAANQAGLDPEMVKTIAQKNGIKNPDQILDTLGDIKTGRATIANADEAAKLQKTTRDILDAAEAKTKTAAAAEVQKTQSQIADMEAKGLKTQAQQARNELADYNAKAKATTEAVRGPNEPVTKPGGTKTVVGEPEVKTTSGGKLMKGAGLALGAYGIYEGYKTAKEEMEAKRQGEPKDMAGWTKEKAELVHRTLWHGLGFGSMNEIGTKAGKEAYDQYRKDIESGKISEKDWKPYLEMKTKAVAGALFGGAKAITYDAAKQAGTNLGNAFGEGLGAGKGLFDQLKSARNEKAINEARSKEIYDKLIKNGASPVGAKIAADGVLKGDFAEAKRLNKVLEGKKAAKLAAAEQETKTRTWRDRKKTEMRKDATKQTAQTAKAGTEDEQKLLDLVIARLRAANLPVNDNLVNRCLTALKDGGEKALAEVIKEFTSMEGTFAGRVTMPDKTGASLRITIKGGRVTGSFSQSTSQNLGTVSTTRHFAATVTGKMDLASGAIEMQAKGRITATATADKKTQTHSMEGEWTFRGSFNGNGYKGSTEMPWSVSH
ncbi:hypothetical protein [Prosthecobacter sp.]|uniref:hypothetical protein n=1 Tax=Prosthecobacter sp. TaxID=1965333 RepID=UPI002AB9487C|nr:hypothetical protein [Prosthecobacter sp.]MDZ4404585.1 hypothetical protein [Prosthecobacter sp.]